MSRINQGKQSGFKEVKDLPQATILENCRTVVEKKDFVSTGVMSYAEGDMLEVEIGDYERFDLGDSVKLTVYTPAGIYIIHTTIIGRDVGSLMIIHPPENQRKFGEKRRDTRVEVSKSGLVYSFSPTTGAGNRQALNRPLPFEVKNISLSGVGFTVPEGLKVDPQAEVELEIDLGTIIPCVAEIIRREPVEQGFYYGARYTHFFKENLNTLRAFILREQIAAHSIRKQNEKRKRMFN